MQNQAAHSSMPASRASASSHEAMRRSVLGPLAAILAWSAVLVTLNLTTHPLIAGSTFVAIAVLAQRSGLHRLVLLALLGGLGLLLVAPGIALVDGSFEFSYGSGVWEQPSGPGQWLLAMASALRIPAQVLAATFLVLIPAALLLA